MRSRDARRATGSGSRPWVEAPSESSITAPGALWPRGPSPRSSRASAAASALPVAVPPLGRSRSSSARASSRWARSGSMACTAWLNVTAPTRSPPGVRSRKRSAAARTAATREGSTSRASMEPETSVTSTTAARSSATATVVSGRARAIAATVSSPPPHDCGGRPAGSRRPPEAGPAAPAGTRAPGSSRRALRPLVELDRDGAALAVADHLDLDLVAGTVRRDGVGYVLGLVDSLAVYADDDVACEQAFLLRRPARHDRLNRGPLRSGRSRDAEVGTHDRLAAGEPRHDVSHGIGRNGEADADVPAVPGGRGLGIP